MTDAVRSPEEWIADAFNRYFRKFGIRISRTDVKIGSRRFIDYNGWGVAYRVVADDGGFPSLEFYAGHRMTEDRHVLIWADGACQRLEAINQWVTSREDVIRIADELREKGIFPDPALFNEQ